MFKAVRYLFNYNLSGTGFIQLIGTVRNGKQTVPIVIAEDMDNYSNTRVRVVRENWKGVYREISIPIECYQEFRELCRKFKVIGYE